MQISKNILSNESSPYLKQHKDNPVNWQVWSSETLEFAKKNKMPILLSTDFGAWIKTCCDSYNSFFKEIFF